MLFYYNMQLHSTQCVVVIFFLYTFAMLKSSYNTSAFSLSAFNQCCITNTHCYTIAVFFFASLRRFAVVLFSLANCNKLALQIFSVNAFYDLYLALRIHCIDILFNLSWDMQSPSVSLSILYRFLMVSSVRFAFCDHTPLLCILLEEIPYP